MQGLRLIDLYSKRGIDTNRIYIKVRNAMSAELRVDAHCSHSAAVMKGIQD